MWESGATPARGRPRFGLLARVWHTPAYRIVLLFMVLMSLGFSASLPLIALYLVRDVGVGLSTAALFFTGMALPGLVLGVLIGRRSDRWRSRLPFIRGATLWVGVGWFVLAFSPAPWLTLAVGAVFLSLGGALTGQLYATLHDVMTRDGEPQPQRINTTIRTGWSFGFVFGPLVGGVLATVAGFRDVFVVTGCLSLLCLLLLRGRGLAVPVPARPAAPEEAGGRATLLPLAFIGLCALVLSGQTIRNTYLPIHVTAHLGGSVATFGTLMAVSPVVELVALPLAGVLADRLGLGRLIAGGLVIAAIEYVCVASSTALWQLYATQAVDACVVAVVLGLGMTYAQRLSPERPGAVSSLFASAFNVSGIVGGLIGGAAVPVLGVPHVFFLPAFMCAASWIAFLGVERAARQAECAHVRAQ
jgi:SET family sugar efflux transporter-like MFS transporter